MSVCYRLYELIFHIGIAKKVKPFVNEAKKANAEMEAKTKSKKTAMAKATKEMNQKKAEMEKQASRDSIDLLQYCDQFQPPATAPPHPKIGP